MPTPMMLPTISAIAAGRPNFCAPSLPAGALAEPGASGGIWVLSAISAPAGGRWRMAFSGPPQPETARFPSLPGRQAHVVTHRGVSSGLYRRLAGARRKAFIITSLARNVFAEFPENQQGEGRDQGPAELAQVDLGGAQQAVEEAHLGDQDGQDELPDHRPVHLLAVER